MCHNKDYVQNLVQSIPYEEECSPVTSFPDSTDILKYQERIKNLTIELTALKLFGKEQFYIRRYEDMTTRRYENTQEPQNRKSISSLKEEIDFF